jgi:hypothetical protein
VNPVAMVALLLGPALLVSFMVSLAAGKMALQLILGSLDRGTAPAQAGSRQQVQ